MWWKMAAKSKNFSKPESKSQNYSEVKGYKFIFRN